LVPRNCPTFSCADLDSIGNLDSAKLKTSCPDAHFLLLEVSGKAAAGKGKLAYANYSFPATTTAYGLTPEPVNELDLTNAAGPIAGSVKVGGEGDAERIEGSFSAALCPSS
jgi:hypothetical protein